MKETKRTRINPTQRNPFIRRRLLLHHPRRSTRYVRVQFSFSCKHSYPENIEKEKEINLLRISNRIEKFILPFRNALCLVQPLQRTGLW